MGRFNLEPMSFLTIEKGVLRLSDTRASCDASDFKGGDRLKFADVVIAVALLAVIATFLLFGFGIVLIPVSTYYGPDLASILSVLVASLIVGYVFALERREESRMSSIGKVLLLFVALLLVTILAEYGAIGHASAAIDDMLRSTYSTSSWTNTDWFAYEELWLSYSAALSAAVGLVFGFVGLYVGSIRKPTVQVKA